MVESELKDRLEFLAFATIRYYPQTAEFKLEHSVSGSAGQSTLTSAA
jgi:hypothetical protein